MYIRYEYHSRDQLAKSFKNKRILKAAFNEWKVSIFLYRPNLAQKKLIAALILKERIYIADEFRKQCVWASTFKIWRERLNEEENKRCMLEQAKYYCTFHNKRKVY